jgi:exodeoxyribonuclease VII large subunit
MVTVLHRRCPSVGIVILPVQVQGEGSGEQIANAIRAAGNVEEVDVLIVGRGGGSSEDLWSFNDEGVVRAIVASPVPVVSAVGHETDVTLADFAADVRAPTPSAAAEAAVPVLDEVRDRMKELGARCRQAVVWRLSDERRRVALGVADLTRFRFRLLDAAQAIDGAVLQMTQIMQDHVKHDREMLTGLTFRLHGQGPQAQVRHGLAVLPQIVCRLHAVMRQGIHRRSREIRACMDHLHHLSPLAILTRGYSIVEHLPTHQVVLDAQQLSVGDEILARLSRGRLRCAVREVIPDSSMQNDSTSGYNQV